MWKPGGRIDYLGSYQSVGWWYGQPVGQHIEMICKDYDYNSSTKRLTGVWGNNAAFNIQLVNVSGYDAAINNIKFTIIPKPASFVLLFLGVLFTGRS